MKSSTVIIVIIALLLIGGVVYFVNNPKASESEVLPNQNTEEGVAETLSVNYLCDGGKSIAATYNNTEENVTISLSDERVMTLPLAISASGARFANADETQVFWNKGNTAFFEENGEITYADCVAEGTQAEEGADVEASSENESEEAGESEEVAPEGEAAE